MNQFKRAVASYRLIKDIDPEMDIRVRIMGRVIGKQDGTLVVDDGSGKADIVLDEQDAETNDIVRVFARVLPLESGYELRAELIQKLDEQDAEKMQEVFLKAKEETDALEG